jgi:hypothetical protein
VNGLWAPLKGVETLDMSPKLDLREWMSGVEGASVAGGVKAAEMMS